MEFAQVFSRLGSKVTVLTGDDRVLSCEDPEISGHVACMLTGEGITIKRRATVKKVELRGDQKVCIYHDAESGETTEVSSVAILGASARLANVEDLNLESLGIHADPEHGIEVDELLQTHAIRVYAIGDVLKRHQYAHAAEAEAEVAFQNAVLRRRRKMDYANLPWATFLDPEVATVGISEARAKANELEHRVFRVNYADIDRAGSRAVPKALPRSWHLPPARSWARPSWASRPAWFCSNWWWRWTPGSVWAILPGRPRSIRPTDRSFAISLHSSSKSALSGASWRGRPPVLRLPASDGCRQRSSSSHIEQF